MRSLSCLRRIFIRKLELDSDKIVKLLNSESRVKRLARGSGTSEEDVSVWGHTLVRLFIHHDYLMFFSIPFLSLTLLSIWSHSGDGVARSVQSVQNGCGKYEKDDWSEYVDETNGKDGLQWCGARRNAWCWYERPSSDAEYDAVDDGWWRRWAWWIYVIDDGLPWQVYGENQTGISIKEKKKLFFDVIIFESVSVSLSVFHIYLSFSFSLLFFVCMFSS